MSSFGVKNILRKDIVTYDVFFNSANEMVEYLEMKNPQYYYRTIAAESVVKARAERGDPMEIIGCMKQHLMIFKPNEPVFGKEYLCDCTCCLQFDFKNFCNENLSDDNDDDDTPCDNEEDVDCTDQIFEFITVPSFVSLYTGSSLEPLFFVKLTGKGIAERNLSDPYGHFIVEGEKYFEGFYLKMVRSKNAKVKRFSMLPSKIYLAPDEIYDNYIDFNEQLELDATVYIRLLQKASS